MHDIAAEGSAGDHPAGKTESGFAAEDRNLDGTSILEDGDERDNRLVREIDGSDRLADFIDDLTL